ncbi:hypothetical protein A2130_03775 [Candidatus Woesebacteria bacterium GWC2_33_12]|uniref:Uncharacterized protein n=1 Tax=Candidatus Woesebacteria bacterium GW2011_GWB1_33_22 TaxID=1618566 RepID=A0A0G0A2S2_9BACT|nr:MAG: hypothetical protein UR29_C0001G0076 [Candidatus Woesebacteria bacterium GW2011_GWC2_33_12]KKP42714.1 MAG: hypothetical protein UR33_C0001G0075 [Candidatus Woesebacteria bacterium GW2011_GWA2_33_20]KKP45511.1 MAG: hypothetical protein UR35_C0001G0108 [Candidatus Woesebacteria bacterium GW2011_GWB1_33_22]KKP47383.1 MAG: hypothetical protein UR37_C0001G0076 [Microgenomates group bacterium GW2011_GWC1_33_28]KKP51129.1 MAG: hypothetical protein UR41_C0001G0076 [Candidatus Woesebacteria bact
MNKILKILFFIFSLPLFYYVSLSNSEFPDIPPNSVQSNQPADVETPFRRGYYTNLTREEVIEHYKKEFNNKNNLYTLRLNYPPEESQTIIRDQTRSTYLEELTHPLRESLYISGLEAKNSIYQFNINGVDWQQKIIIRYIPSNVYVRILVMILTIGSSLFLIKEFLYVK